jgi:uncharacterized membrane protein
MDKMVAVQIITPAGAVAAHYDSCALVYLAVVLFALLVVQDIVRAVLAAFASNALHTPVL